MRKCGTWIVVWIGTLLAASAAWGISPGSADRKSALPNVCEQGPLQGALCDPTDVEPCGVDGRGMPFECAVDFPAAPTLRGELTLVADEAVGDNDSSGGNPTITVLMEFQNAGQRYFVAKTYQSATPSVFPEIGHWAAPQSEAEIDGVATSWIYQTPFAALEDVGTALQEVASEVFGRQVALSATTPVIFSVKESGNRAPVDQYARTDLGQVARFHIEIKFLEP